MRSLFYVYTHPTTKTKTNRIVLTFGERDHYNKAEKVRRFRAQKFLNLFRRKKKVSSVYVVFVFGYAKSTVYKARKAGYVIPEYYYKSETIFSPPKITPKRVTDFVADAIEDNFEFYSSDTFREQFPESAENDPHNLRKVVLSFIYHK